MGAAYLGVTVFIVVMVAVLIPAIGEFARASGEQGSDSVASLSEWTEDVFGVTVFHSGVAQSGAEGAEEFIGGWASEVFGAGCQPLTSVPKPAEAAASITSPSFAA